MGIDLSNADCVVLSHGHYDHCGGLVHFRSHDNPPKVYLHRDALSSQYALNPDSQTYRRTGVPSDLDDLGDMKGCVVFSDKHTSLAPDIDLIGEMPYVTSFECVNPHLLTGDGANRLRDTMRDEQMLVVSGDRGLVILLGCSHPGVISCVNHALSVLPGQSVNTLIAGMHLDKVDPERLQATISHLLDLDIERIIPLHCTGMQAILPQTPGRC